MRAPEHVILRVDHPVHKALKELDDTLELRFNAKLTRYEVWNTHGFVQRVVGPDGFGFAEPGDWLIPHLKRLDARFAGAHAAVRAATEMVDKANLDREVKRQQEAAARQDEKIDEALERVAFEERKS